MRFSILVAAAFSAALMCGQAAIAQEGYPNRPITIIVGFPPGGLMDVLVRTAAETARKDLGQALVVENRPGVAGSLALRLLAEKPGDGYTLGMLGGASVINQHIREAGYNTDRDFTPVVMMGQTRFGLIVPAGSPWKTLREFIAHAKAKPDTIRYSTPGLGSPQHLTMLRLGYEIGAKWINVPYKSGIEAVTAVERGDVEASPSASEFVQPAKDGRVRLLVAFGEKRMPEFPDVPTAREAGVDIVSFSSFGIVGPKNMDPAVTEKLYQAFRKAIDEERFDVALARFGMVKDVRDPKRYREHLVESSALFADLVKKVQFKVSD